ncbi:unnamed protein product, partial [Heligmosomoides polygyrus]
NPGESVSLTADSNEEGGIVLDLNSNYDDEGEEPQHWEQGLCDGDEANENGTEETAETAEAIDGDVDAEDEKKTPEPPAALAEEPAVKLPIQSKGSRKERSSRKATDEQARKRDDGSKREREHKSKKSITAGRGDELTAYKCIGRALKALYEEAFTALQLSNLP